MPRLPRSVLPRRLAISMPRWRQLTGNFCYELSVIARRQGDCLRVVCPYTRYQVHGTGLATVSIDRPFEDSGASLLFNNA